MTAIVIPFPSRSYPKSLTQRDLGEITAETRALPGPWVAEVASNRDELERLDEVCVFLFLKQASDTQPYFVIRRDGHMIRVTAHDYSEDGIMDCITLGHFQTTAAALSAITHDVQIMAMQWGIEPSVACARPAAWARFPERSGGEVSSPA